MNWNKIYKHTRKIPLLRTIKKRFSNYQKVKELTNICPNSTIYVHKKEIYFEIEGIKFLYTYDLSPRLHENKIFEHEELNKIKQIKPNCKNILDIGACYGSYSLGLSKVFPNANIIALEPTKNFILLEKNVKINNAKNIKLKKVAISNKEGYVRFSENVFANNSVSDKGTKIKCTTIDKLKLKNKIDFIKLDVEGHELEAIEGMINTLKKDKPLIQIELNFMSGKKKIIKIKELLRKLNYKRIHDFGNKNYLYK